MPAGNDVTECICFFNGQKKHVFIKTERSKMAFFENEIMVLKQLKNNNLYNKIPELLEHGYINNKKYIVLSKTDGKRLSEILIDDDEKKKKRYLMKYGFELSLIHKIDCSYFNEAKQRIINDIPSKNDYKVMDDFILNCISYLTRKRPQIKKNTFIHGDFHYANVLWKNGRINGVLDFEYTGYGFKEQDIAWSLVLRPSQKFMDNINDIKYFLNGYKQNGEYNKDNLKWCLINCYCHFYLMNQENHEYVNKIKKLITIFMEDDAL